MNIILNSSFKPKLIIKNKIIYCQIGKNKTCPKFKKIEGDKCTPIGKWRINKIYYRKDKFIFRKVNFFLKNKITQIKKSDLWCDDMSSSYYNKCYNNKHNKKLNFSYETLFRDDDVYDIIIQINYNQNPIIKGKGSAIFIHCSFSDFRNTNGCVAITKNNMKFLINNLQTKNYIYIS